MFSIVRKSGLSAFQIETRLQLLQPAVYAKAIFPLGLANCPFFV
jgi:hypothetical protein